MLLHKTMLMELHYEPKTDILRVQWPDIQEATSQEIDHSFAKIRDAIQSYYIKRFLIDSRQTSHLPDMELLKQVTSQFMLALAGTSLQKIARLQSLSAERESRTRAVTDQVSAEKYLKVQFQNFTDEQEAVDWLQKD